MWVIYKAAFSTRNFEDIHHDEGIDLTQNSVICSVYQTTTFKY